LLLNDPIKWYWKHAVDTKAGSEQRLYRMIRRQNVVPQNMLPPACATCGEDVDSLLNGGGAEGIPLRPPRISKRVKPEHMPEDAWYMSTTGGYGLGSRTNGSEGIYYWR
jgi:hypothetical protein